jgi:RNA polymerase sigma-70 factor (ECF subfamily)
MSAAVDIHAGHGPGDPVAFARIYEDFSRPVLRYLQAMLRDPAEAEDALHEVFLKAWRALPPYASSSALRAWLFTVARTTAIDHARRQARQAPVAPQRIVSIVDAGGGAREPAPADHWITEPEVRAVLARLPARHQEIIVLRYLMGCSHGETARALGLSELAVRKAHQRILAVLGQALAASDLAASRGVERKRTRYAMGQLRLPRRLALGGFSLLPRLSSAIR